MKETEHLTDEQWDVVFGGKASPEMLEHIENCKKCKQLRELLSPEALQKALDKVTPEDAAKRARIVNSLGRWQTKAKTEHTEWWFWLLLGILVGAILFN